MIFFYCLVYVMPMIRHPLWSDLIADMTVVKYLGAAAGMFAVIRIVLRRRVPRFVETPQSRWFLAFTFWAIASFLVHGGASSGALNPLLSYTSFLLLFFITQAFVDSSTNLRRTILVAVGSVGYASLHVLREWQNSGFAPGYRPGWVVGDPNYYSISALLCLPVTYYLARESRRPWEIAFCWGCLILSLVGLTIAASRGGFLGLCVAVLLVVWRAPQRWKLLGAAVGFLVPMMLVMPSSPVARLLFPDRSANIGSDARLKLWQAGLRMMVHRPLMGVGVGRFKMNALSYGADDDPELVHIAHNTFIGIGAEMGVPGLVLYLGLFGATLRSLVRQHAKAVRIGAGLIEVASEGLGIGLVAFGVAAFFVSAEYQKLFWLVLFISMCLPPLLQSVRRGLEKGERIEHVAWNRPSRVRAA